MNGRTWHKSMTPERWCGYTRERQILMIGSEFARAKALLQSGPSPLVAECFERAFELLDLCTHDPQWRKSLRELLRFREALGELYLDPRQEMILLFYRVLMNWSGATSTVEL